MTSPRRSDAAATSTREKLLDAAERLLLEEGYAAVTSRRVGARADLAPQLVHYYFRTMDDLFLEIFRRRADVGLQMLRDALRARPTLRQLWAMREIGMTSSRFNLEFMALANHRKAIRSSILEYYRAYRQLQLDAFTAALADLGIPEDRFSPRVAQVAMIGMTQVMAIDADLGIASDDEAVFAAIDAQLLALESSRHGPERVDLG
ncbi:TetR family transcriptional regulator [Frankia sp. AiPs1]|uniref:TetR/AcrR family transcriptional regulator n=1 Tax=Frankia sp. AiPa1 TaxID=573492 RepID=UPI00202BA1A7|nr:TetR/AcrR family transcriptional regulator [Frankia sp. AiPa1]MCL9760076.1 TetR/AcrR family transcriptional regulator [Frankia sp. AiPa1]